MVLSVTTKADEEGFRLEMFDVGSGLAVWVEVGGYRLLYDTGPGLEEEAIISELLQGRLSSAHGRGQSGLVDDLVLSQQHQDHMGGLAAVGQRTWARRILAPKSIESGPIEHFGAWHAGARGQMWMVKDWVFTVLHPGPSLPDLGGNSSCILHIKGPSGSILLASGLDEVGEAHVLQQWPALEADVMVVSSSGHEKGTSEAWLAQLLPSVALISVASSDRYGRPSQRVIDRLKRHQIQTLTTAHCGAIRVDWFLDGAGPQLKTAVGSRKRFFRSDHDCP